MLRCGCLQSEEGLPLAPWDRILLSLREFIQEEQLSLPVPVQVRLGQAFPLFRSENAWPGGVSARALRQWDQGLEDSLLLLFSAVTRRKKVLLVLEGEAEFQWEGGSLRARRGEELFVPHGVASYQCTAEGTCRLLECGLPGV